MINKTELSSKIIKEFTDKDGVCKYSKKKLGEILHERHPDLFKNSEDARTFIRITTGAKGSHVTTPKLSVKWNGFKLPEPEKNDFTKVIVNQKRIGILSDIHFPYHDRKALDSAVKYLIDFKPDCIILNGDIIDCYQLSSFEKDKRQRSFKYELDMLSEFFVQLRKIFPKQRILYKLGNHERRYERSLLQNLPELLELELFTFSNVIKARDHGIEVVGNQRIMKAGHLNIAHGDEFRGGIIAPVNPARGYFLKAKTNILCGHNHRTSSHIERDLSDKIIGGWSTGCLCELTPQYMPINNHNHGFATVVVKDETFSVNNITIINGKIA